MKAGLKKSITYEFRNNRGGMETYQEKDTTVEVMKDVYMVNHKVFADAGRLLEEVKIFYPKALYVCRMITRYNYEGKE